MRRHWLFLALLLSVGINCGLLGMGILRHRLLAGAAASDRFDRFDRSTASIALIAQVAPSGRQAARVRASPIASSSQARSASVSWPCSARSRRRCTRAGCGSTRRAMTCAAS